MFSTDNILHTELPKKEKNRLRDLAQKSIRYNSDEWYTTNAGEDFRCIMTPHALLRILNELEQLKEKTQGETPWQER